MKCLHFLVGAFILVSCGCGASDHERLVQEQLTCLHEAAAILDGTVDAATAAAARPKLHDILKRLREQNDRGRALDPLSPQAHEDLTQKHRQASQSAIERLREAARAAEARPGCREVVREFQHEFIRLVR